MQHCTPQGACCWLRQLLNARLLLQFPSLLNKRVSAQAALEQKVNPRAFKQHGRVLLAANTLLQCVHKGRWAGRCRVGSQWNGWFSALKLMPSLCSLVEVLQHSQALEVSPVPLFSIILEKLISVRRAE